MAVKLEILLQHRLVLRILLDTVTSTILGHISMSEKLKSAHPVLSSPILAMKTTNLHLAKREELFD